MKKRYCFLLVLFLFISLNTWADSEPDDIVEISITGGTDILVSRFGESDQRILWLPSEFGFGERNVNTLARSMAEQGLEIWVADLHGSYFLTPGRTSLSKIADHDVAELIELSLPEKPEQRLYLLSTGRGAALALMGLKTWQQARPADIRFGGAVLVHPNLVAGSPEPGQEETWLPIAEQTYAPLFIIQPEKSGKRWYLQDLVKKLQTGGSAVYQKLVRDVSDGYLTRPERSEAEVAQAQAFPELLQQATKLLASTALRPPPQLASRDPDPQDESGWQQGSGIKEGLQPFPGNELAPELALPATDGKTYDLRDYRGKVVLLNFWATWCPPCVEEIPSLGRLQKKFPADQFVVLSVDMGEEKADVEKFLQTVKAEYPVMLDPDGSTVRDWKLRAFPTTFVIDREGYIRLAYFGALEWDDDSVVQTLSESLQLQPLAASR